MTNRDDFSEKVKQVLRDRVGGFCSNPSCRVSTTGPHTNPQRRLSVGEAAHITAAAPGGARYNPNLRPEERSSAENGIWLCSKCADLIDKDPSAYPVEMIIDWKLQAEAEQTKRLLDPNFGKAGGAANNTVVVQIGSDSNNLWLKLVENLEKYQSVIDYAYAEWNNNFKKKYPNLHEKNEWGFNSGIQGLQDEIDKYGETLYKPMLDWIYGNYSETKSKLIDSMNFMKVEISQQLESFLKDYLNCMTFSYESDAGVGLVDYYWSSFFATLDKNYEKIGELKKQIDDLIRKEYKMVRRPYF